MGRGWGCGVGVGVGVGVASRERPMRGNRFDTASRVSVILMYASALRKFDLHRASPGAVRAYSSCESRLNPRPRPRSCPCPRPSLDLTPIRLDPTHSHSLLRLRPHFPASSLPRMDFTVVAPAARSSAIDGNWNGVAPTRSRAFPSPPPPRWNGKHWQRGAARDVFIPSRLSAFSVPMFYITLCVLLVRVRVLVFACSAFRRLCMLRPRSPSIVAVAAAPILTLHPRSVTRPGHRPSFFFVARTLPSRRSHLSGLEAHPSSRRTDPRATTLAV
ncbi:hypothetical protein K438DRAFT_1982376 [Mycena galopus ATCC 62051]|nr:hypothetical protein K438DRAFT_1982376 [Mycena galopus ATCC 62051]